MKNLSKKKPSKKIQKNIKCKCGCGNKRTKYDKQGRIRRYISGHSKRGISKYNHLKNIKVKCKCGCGESRFLYNKWGYKGEYINGHQNRCKKHTEKSKRNMSESTKNFYKNGGNHPMKGKRHTEETKEKNRIIAYNRPITNDMFKDTKPERMLRCILSINCIQYESQKKLYGKPDIFIEPNICIFEDGDYHHANPNKLKHKNCPNYLFNDWGKVKNSQQIWDKDERVTKKLEDQGYKVIRIWEHEVYEDPMGCLEKIVKYI